MSDARFWVALGAVVAFLAGTAFGTWRTRAAERPPSVGWGAYAERLADEFQLAPERRAHLRILLDEYASELESRRRAHEARIEAELQPELRALAARIDGYIRDLVLPPDQRERYDRLSRPKDIVAQQ